MIHRSYIMGTSKPNNDVDAQLYPDYDKIGHVRIPDFAYELHQSQTSTERMRRRLNMMRKIVILAETNTTINDLIEKLETTYSLLG